MIKRFKRVNYFDGQMLQPEDFSAEQDYFLSKLRLHNRLAIGAGVAEGLEVWQKDKTLIIEPGIALDCIGRELVLSEPVEITIEASEQDNRFVMIEYLETETDPVPSIEVTEESLEFSRIAEGVKVFLGTSVFLKGHNPRGDRFEACNHEHPLPIAVIRSGIAMGIGCTESK